MFFVALQLLIQLALSQDLTCIFWKGQTEAIYFIIVILLRRPEDFCECRSREVEVGKRFCGWQEESIKHLGWCCSLVTGKAHV